MCSPCLGRRRAVQVSPSDVTRYVEQRRQQGAANATINRELSALRRAFKLAVRAEKIPRQPSIVALEENNTRQGFFERDQCEAVRTHLPAHLRPVVIFAYITGWRTRSGALTRRSQHVDFKAGTVCLDPGETKNVEGCTCHMTPELRACLEAQWPRRKPSSARRAESFRGSSTIAAVSRSRTTGSPGGPLAGWPGYPDASHTISGGRR
jgi:integrase